MKLVAFILSFIMLSSVVIPCYAIDNCDQEERTTGSHDSEEGKDCTDCSPFSICSIESGFTTSNFNLSIEPVTFNFTPKYCDLYFAFSSEYYSSLFQPPRYL